MLFNAAFAYDIAANNFFFQGTEVLKHTDLLQNFPIYFNFILEGFPLSKEIYQHIARGSHFTHQLIFQVYFLPLWYHDAFSLAAA